MVSRVRSPSNEWARGVLLYRLEITQEAGASERQLGPGAVVIGGGLTADLVIPALIDNELCELILPSTGGKPIKITALVDGLVVNGREIKRGQSVSSSTLEFSADGVVLKVAAPIDEAEALTVPPPSTQEKLSGLLDRFRKGGGETSQVDPASADAAPKRRLGVPGLDPARLDMVAANPVVARLRANPAAPLLLLALGLGLVAFLISGWPSARFNTQPFGSVSAGAPGDVASLSAELRRRLIAADLAGVVKVEPADKAVRLTGTVDANQAQRLGDVIKTVTRPGAPAILNEVVMTSADAATGIEAVVLAPMKGVVVTGGRLFREGQTIPSGWLVERIESERVLLRRDAMSFSLAMARDASPGGSGQPARSSGIGSPASSPKPAPARRGFEPISAPPHEPPAESFRTPGAPSGLPPRSSPPTVISK